MFTIISFILTLLGCINWLSIGLLQYDFVAGIFGYQASAFSRIIYIIVGISSLFLTFKLIKGKGVLNIFSKKNKKNLKENLDKIGQSDDLAKQKAYSSNYNVEADKDFLSNHNIHSNNNKFRNNDRFNDFDEYDKYDGYSNTSHNYNKRNDGLFNEEFDDYDK